MNPNDQMAAATSKTVDFDIDGKQHGFLALPYSSEQSAWGSVQLPVTVIRNGSGPCVAMLAGMFGDEPNGTVALHRLARDIDPANINGTLLILPCINPPAAQHYSRRSPLDNKNLNRCFPGDVNGSVSARIAHMLSIEIIDRADVVLDVQSGGKSMAYAPSAVVHFLKDREQQTRAEASMISFGAPNSVRMLELQERGMLDSHVESMKKIMLTILIGSGGGVDSHALKIANTGCRNVLVQMGVLNEEIQLRATRMLEVENDACMISAPCDGMLELFASAGQEVYHGNPIAHIINPLQTGAKPEPIIANKNGVVLAHHFSGNIRQGDCLAVIADEVQR
ncbi:MAG: succinylglutamate desuccinylase/aspartoacylase family protein [Granulosicoccaceae bacterium]